MACKNKIKSTCKTNCDYCIKANIKNWNYDWVYLGCNDFEPVK
jgi:hypothetical protein